MKRPAVLLALGGVLVAMIVGIGYGDLHHVIGRYLRPRQAPHVFVNETTDHRFDESIRVSILAAFKRTGVHHAVVISDRIRGEDFASEASRLFARLRLGEENQGRAVLYLFSPQQQLLKIEVGYALEGALPDAKVRGLEAAAKSFTFRDRYQDFWAELINTLNIELQSADVKSPTPDFAPPPGFAFQYFSGGAGLTARDHDISPAQFAREMKLLKPGEQKDFRPSADPRETLARYLESLRRGVGGQDLPLLATESRFFRSITPMTREHLWRDGKMLNEAGLDKLVVSEEMAFALFRPEHPVLPVVLVWRGGVWLVQEALSWSLFQRFEDSNHVFLKFPLRLKSPAASHELASTFGRPLYPAPTVAPEELADQDDPLRYFYFKFYWLERAQSELRKRDLNRDDELYLAMDIDNNLGQFSDFLKASQMLAARHPGNAEIQKNHAFFVKNYRFDPREWRLSWPD